VTSQMAGAWLDFVLRKGWPLLTPMEGQTAVEAAGDSPTIAA